MGTDDAAFDWCQGNGLLPVAKQCPKHRCAMLFDRSRSGLGQFRCNKGGHNYCISIAKGTWFEGVKLSLSKVFR